MNRVRKALIPVLAVLLILGGITGAGWVAAKRYDLSLIRIDAGSMYPLYPVGTRVLVRGDVAPHRNNIVTFNNPETGGRTTHIFGGYNKDGSIISRGLANQDFDEFDPAPHKSDIVGRAVFSTDILTSAFWYSARGIGVVLLIALLLVLMLVNEAWKKRQMKREEKSAATQPLSASTPA